MRDRVTRMKAFRLEIHVTSFWFCLWLVEQDGVGVEG